MAQKKKTGTALAHPEPARFGLASFMDLMPGKEPLPGQATSAFAPFKEGLLQALAPATPYEAVIAENLIALEWELMQHRRMRDRVLAGEVAEKIVEAYLHARHARHEEELDAEWDAWIAAGKDEDDFQDRPFDPGAACEEGKALAARAVARDPEIVAAAEAEIAALGMDVLALLAEIYVGMSNASRFHDKKIAELEGRRREVKRDLDALQAARPVDVIAEAV